MQKSSIMGRLVFWKRLIWVTILVALSAVISITVVFQNKVTRIEQKLENARYHEKLD